METLVISKRGNLNELYHQGSICVVDKNYNVVYFYGDINERVFIRSTAKVFQILPLLYDKLDLKYDLTIEEIAIMCSSHISDFEHIRVIKQIMEKTGISESDFCIKPAFPADFNTTKELNKNEAKPSPIYHMCSGKHLGLMINEKEVNENYQNYYLETSYSTKKCLEFIALMAQVDVDSIDIGLDGCGVPVFGLSIYESAVAFANLTNYDIEDQKLIRALKIVEQAYREYPDMVRGKNMFCSYHNYDKNVIGKDGADGFYGFSLKNEGLGAAFKIYSGNLNMLSYVVERIYEKINYDSSELKKHYNNYYENDNKQIIGEHIAIF